jgi:hypothetical protein
MKNKLRILFKYLKGMGIDNITFRADLDNGIEWFELNIEDNASSTIEEIIQDIIEVYQDKLYELGPGTLDSPNDYFSVDGEILPNEGKFIFTNIDYQGYGTEESGTGYGFEEYEEGDSMYDTFIAVGKFLDEIRATSATVGYSGGGDSGAVDINYETPNGLSGIVPDNIENIAYYLLQEYGGWEINEGSQGNIVFTKDEIEVNHEWNTQEDYNEEINIVITLDTFSE